jgi:hypothetical protein
LSQELFWKDPQGNWVKCDTPEKSKSMHLERIRKRHEALEKEGFLCSLGWRMNIGTEHASLLDGGIRYAEQKGQATITIRDWNNERHEDVPLEIAKGILQEIVERQMTLLYGKWSLQERVRSASRWEDIETLEAEYERGW